MLSLLIAILGLALVLVLIYCAVTNTELPPSIKLIILIALALIVLLCLLKEAGCAPPIFTPMPH